MTGYAVEELLGKPSPWKAYIHPDDFERIVHVVRTLPPGQRTSYEVRIFTKNKELRWIRSYAQPVIDPTGKVTRIYGAAQDITEQKHAAETLRKAEEKYQDIFENAQEGIFQTTPSGRFLSANPALARLFGYESPEALIAQVTNIGQQLFLDPHHRIERTRNVEQCGRAAGTEF